MRHNQLKAFHHVALSGGFSLAAEALNLTQPAISEQVRNLEQSYDVLLFQRDRKKVTLTETGRSLFKISRHYFEVEQQMTELLSESSAVISGELRIVADSAYHIADILSSFQEKFPRITISLMTGNSADVLSRLRSYEAEIGVLGSLTPGSDMESINLGSTEIFGFCTNSFDLGGRQKLSFRDLENYPLVLRENGSKTRMKLEQRAQELGITLKPAIIAEGREAVRAIVAAGAGIGFVSDAEFGSEPHFRKLALDGTSIQMNESIVYLKQRRDVRLIRAFREIALGSDEAN